MMLAIYGMIINDEKEFTLIYQLLLICITSSMLFITRQITRFLTSEINCMPVNSIKITVCPPYSSYIFNLLYVK